MSHKIVCLNSPQAITVMSSLCWYLVLGVGSMSYHKFHLFLMLEIKKRSITYNINKRIINTCFSSVLTLPVIGLVLLQQNDTYRPALNLHDVMEWTAWNRRVLPSNIQFSNCLWMLLSTMCGVKGIGGSFFPRQTFSVPWISFLKWLQIGEPALSPGGMWRVPMRTDWFAWLGIFLTMLTLYLYLASCCSFALDLILFCFSWGCLVWLLFCLFGLQGYAPQACMLFGVSLEKLFPGKKYPKEKIHQVWQPISLPCQIYDLTYSSRLTKGSRTDNWPHTHTHTHKLLAHSSSGNKHKFCMLSMENKHNPFNILNDKNRITNKLPDEARTFEGSTSELITNF